MAKPLLPGGRKSHGTRVSTCPKAWDLAQRFLSRDCPSDICPNPKRPKRTRPDPSPKSRDTNPMGSKTHCPSLVNTHYFFEKKHYQLLMRRKKPKKNYKNKKFTDACLSNVSWTGNDFKVYGALINLRQRLRDVLFRGWDRLPIQDLCIYKDIMKKVLTVNCYAVVKKLTYRQSVQSFGKNSRKKWVNYL